MVEAHAALAHGLEAGPSQRQEARLVLEVDRMLGEEQRRGLEQGDDTVAGKDAGDSLSHVLVAANHEPVPAPLVVRLRVVAPVRLGVEEVELARPVVATDVARPEVVVERGHQAVELHHGGW